MAGQAGQNRFNGFPRTGKPLKRLTRRNACATRLKPGVNESNGIVTHFYESHQSGGKMLKLSMTARGDVTILVALVPMKALVRTVSRRTTARVAISETTW
jgi:hypothetical protein